tara:strand:+ start:530 stop:1240 length:711 start_codon:yes stop_codon:yes gene_type:complete
MKNYLKFNTSLFLLDFLGEIKTFVQVGSHDGNMHDPIREFILRNRWSGILIEPQKQMLEESKKNYKGINNLIFVNAAVFKDYKDVELFTVKDAKDYSHTGWASIKISRFKDTIYENTFITDTVPGIPLMEIIKENNFNKIDLLQIDTEGYDAEIIAMFDFNKFSPKLIQYEHIHLSADEKNKTNEIIIKHGYKVYEKKNDVFAIRKDQLSNKFKFFYLILRLYQSIYSRITNMIKR